jgi:hypothetical protein
MEAQLASPSLPDRMRASLAGEWRRAGPAWRFAYLGGGALVLVGLAHPAAWLVFGGARQGPVPFHKSATGISFGLTTVTLAWVTSRPRVADRTRWLLLGPLALRTPAPRQPPRPGSPRRPDGPAPFRRDRRRKGDAR